MSINENKIIKQCDGNHIGYCIKCGKEISIEGVKEKIENLTSWNNTINRDEVLRILNENS